MSVCKPLGLIDDLTRFFLPTNQRRSRVSSVATMSVSNSAKPVGDVSTVLTVSKLLQQKPKQAEQRQLLRSSKGQKRLSPAVHVAKRLKQKSMNKSSKIVSHTKLMSDSHKVTKPKQRRHRQPRDHVESLIDGLTDYFAAHGERRLKSPALKSIASYGPEGQQTASSQQLDSPTTTMFSPEFSHKPRKHKKATVEKLFDGLSSFFAVQNEYRRQPSSPVLSAGQDAGVKNAAVDGRTGTVSAETKLSHLLNIPSMDTKRKMMAEKNSQLKGLFDGLSHLYTAHGDRKRKSPFFYTTQPAKSRALGSQQSASPVKQESVCTGPEVADAASTSQTVKVLKEKQQRMAEKLSTNKSQIPKKSLKAPSSLMKKQLSSSGMPFNASNLVFIQCNFSVIVQLFMVMTKINCINLIYKKLIACSARMHGFVSHAAHSTGMQHGASRPIQ